MVKVKPVEDDISIVSFNYEEEKIANETHANVRKEVINKKAVTVEKRSHKTRKRNRVSRFFTTWTSTVPDAVGVTGIRYIVSGHDHLLRRYIFIFLFCIVRL